MARSLRGADLAKYARQRKRRRQLFRRSLWALVVVLLLGAIWWFAHAATFLITDFAVSGNQTISVADIQTVAEATLTGDNFGVFPRRHALWYPRAELLRNLFQHFPAFARVAVFTTNFGQLQIVVTERAGQYLWCQPDPAHCFLADQSGFVFAPAPEFSGPLFLTFLATASSSPLSTWPLAPTEFANLTKLVTAVNQELSQSVLASSTINRVTLNDADGNLTLLARASGAAADLQLQVNTHQDFDRLAATLQVGLQTEAFLTDWRGPHRLEYLDLRSPGKLIYKFSP